MLPESVLGGLYLSNIPGRLPSFLVKHWTGWSSSTSISDVSPKSDSQKLNNSLQNVTIISIFWLYKLLNNDFKNKIYINI